MKEFVIQDYKLFIGEDKVDNWKILDNAQNYHLFFHLSSFSSPYGILEIPPKIKISKNIKNICKNYIIQNTKHKNNKNIKIDCCLVQNLKKGDKIGEVIYLSNRKVEKF